ncbi:MAG: lysylphosphatidylglycerol synthase transmembrane domain-containing protein [Usitatibacter sp.]
MILHEAGGHRLRAAIISVVLAVGAYAALAFWNDAAKFARAARDVGVATGASILALSLANYALRAVRWRFFLARLGHRLPWRAAVANYVSGFALTTTPGKAGEAIRSVLLKRRHGVAVTDSLAAFFAERFSDVLALALLSALAFAFLPHGGYVAAVVAALVAVALWVAASDARTERVAHAIARVLPHRYAAPLASLIGQAGRLTRGGALAAGFALSIAAWACEGYALHLVMAAMGPPSPAAAAIGIYSIAILGGALLFLPGGLGSTEAFMYVLLMQAGLDPAAAGAATVISRVTTLWFAVLLGWIVLMVSEADLSGARTGKKGP